METSSFSESEGIHRGVGQGVISTIESVFAMNNLHLIKTPGYYLA